jgi:CBS-domain-containing membrane protein
MTQRQPQGKDLVLAPLLEAALLVVLGLASWASHQPLIFASLGPTAYELIETPERRSAKPYNIIMGNLIALLSAFAALWITGAWFVAPLSAGSVPLQRVWAAVLAALLTVFLTLLARATQPAALSTTLLVSLGILQKPREGAIIFISILLITALGEPIRRWRERDRHTA